MPKSQRSTLQQWPSLEPFVSRLTSRSVLSARQRAELLDLPVRVKHVRPGQDFVRPAQRVDHASCVLEGVVGRFDQNSRGERQITSLHVRGDMPDLHSVVQPSATLGLLALSACTVVEVPYAALRRVSSEHPAIAEAFWRDCMADSMILAQWVVNTGRRDAQSRIAHLICEMACRYKVAPAIAAVTFELPLTQFQLAGAVGLTPVHVNRTVKKLEVIGTSFRHKVVRIEDWHALAEVGDFDPQYLQIAPTEERFMLVQ